MPEYLVIDITQLKNAFSREAIKALAESVDYLVTEKDDGGGSGEETWEFLENEKQPNGDVTEFTIATTSTIRYGVEGKWVERILPPGKYSRADFGEDPAPGMPKRFEIKKLVATA